LLPTPVALATRGNGGLRPFAYVHRNNPRYGEWLFAVGSLPEIRRVSRPAPKCFFSDAVDKRQKTSIRGPTGPFRRGARFRMAPGGPCLRCHGG